MAMQTVREMVERELFDDALSMGERSAAMAKRHLSINKIVMTAVNEAIDLLASGRAGDARDKLVGAKATVTEMYIQ